MYLLCLIHCFSTSEMLKRGTALWGWDSRTWGSLGLEMEDSAGTGCDGVWWLVGSKAKVQGNGERLSFPITANFFVRDCLFICIPVSIREVASEYRLHLLLHISTRFIWFHTLYSIMKGHTSSHGPYYFCLTRTKWQAHTYMHTWISAHKRANKKEKKMIHTPTHKVHVLKEEGREAPKMCREGGEGESVFLKIKKRQRERETGEWRGGRGRGKRVLVSRSRIAPERKQRHSLRRDV